MSDDQSVPPVPGIQSVPSVTSDGARMVEMLMTFLRRFIVLPSGHHELILALWIIHTWNIEAAHTTPYILVSSQDPGSGKTRVLDVIGVLACNAEVATDMTEPVAFKMIGRNDSKITLLYDEVDTVWQGASNNWKKRLLNSGYKRGGSAWREQARELIEFSTFCPKVLAGLDNGFLPNTVRDRCIPFPMIKKATSQKVERFSERDLRESRELEAVLQAIEEFSNDFYVDIAAMRPEPLAALGDRQNEISEPLLAIAAVAGVEPELRLALQTVFHQSACRTQSPTQKLFGRIRDAFGGDSKIFSRDLCERLGPAYTGKQLSLWLAPFGIEPVVMRINSQQARGYTLSMFEEMFDFYCEPQGLSLIDQDFDEITDHEPEAVAA